MNHHCDGPTWLMPSDGLHSDASNLHTRCFESEICDKNALNRKCVVASPERSRMTIHLRRVI